MSLGRALYELSGKIREYRDRGQNPGQVLAHPNTIARVQEHKATDFIFESNIEWTTSTMFDCPLILSYSVPEDVFYLQRNGARCV